MKNLTATRLPNGLKILYLFTKNDPISACHLLIPRGTNLEKPGESGLTMLHWSLLLKGTSNRSARLIAEDLDSLGASIGAGTTHDYSEVSCHSMAETFLSALEMMNETLFQPELPSSEIGKEKNALLASIRSKKEHAFTQANEDLYRLLYGSHPYGRAITGTEETVKALTEENIRQWRGELVIPNEAVMAVASNVPFKTMLPHLNRLFGPSVWKKTTSPRSSEISATPKLTASGHGTLTLPFEQAYLLVGFPAPGVGEKDYLPLKILNACLGGGMSARLFMQLREQQGLAYDVGTFYPSKQRGSAFVAYLGLQASRLPEARKRIQQALEDVRAKEIPAQELRETKSYMKGTYILDHQTNSQRAHYLAWWEIQGLGSDTDRRYIDMIDRVTPKDVLKTAQKILSGPSITVEVHPKKGGASLRATEGSAAIS